MVKSFNLLFIALLAILAAHTELKSSLPDFSGANEVAFSSIEAQSNWGNIIPGKGKSLDEQILKAALAFFFLFASAPLAAAFSKKFYRQQLQTYRSTTLRPFHLRI